MNDYELISLYIQHLTLLATIIFGVIQVMKRK